MGKSAIKHNFGKKIDSLGSADYDLMQIARITIADAPLAVATGVHAALDGAAHAAVVTDITNPTVPRNITATAGGTAASIKAIQVIITGTNYADEVITETLPAFTVDTAGSVAGIKAFKTVTQIDIPAHDAASATTAIGFGSVLGVPYKLKYADQVLITKLAGTTDAATYAVSETALESNTVTMAGALDGAKDIEIDLYVK